ncbi:hypothetical protein GCM10018780_82800 [Streptomyces lanatus]|nr:hypothetical protein GCM10018780_82800 [Streptomyces lanatus]
MSTVRGPYTALIAVLRGLSQARSTAPTGARASVDESAWSSVRKTADTQRHHLGGRDLTAEGIRLLAMGGAMSVAHYTHLLGQPGLGLRLTGLCDVAERLRKRRWLAASWRTWP